MSAEIVNLRLARKRAKRRADEATADQNRAAYGRSAKELSLTRYEQAALERSLSGSRRVSPTDADDVS